MNVRVVRMTVCHDRVPVEMPVGCPPVPSEIMLVKVMLIVLMRVFVLVEFMRMNMAMALAQMEPDPGRHQQRCQPKADSSVFTESQNRDCGADERRCGEIGAGARGAETSQGQHK